MKINNDQRGIAPVAIILIVLAVIGVVGAGVYVAMNGVPGSTQANAETILDAFEDTLEQESARVNAAVAVEGMQDGEEVDLEIRFDGSVANAEDGVQVPSRGELSVEGTMQGESVEAEVEYRRIAPRTYFQLTRVGQIAGMPFDLSAVANTWVYVEDQEDGESELPVEVPVDLSCSRDNEAVEDYLDSLEASDVITAITPHGNVVVEDSDGGSENVNVYLLVVSEEKLREVAETVDELSGCENDMNDEENITIEEVTVGIGDESGLVRTMGMTLRAEEESDFDGTMRMSVSLSDFGREMDVEAPADAKSFEELMEQVMMEMFFGADASAMLEGTGDAVPAASGSAETMTDAELEALLSDLEGLQAEWEAEMAP